MAGGSSKSNKVLNPEFQQKTICAALLKDLREQIKASFSIYNGNQFEGDTFDPNERNVTKEIKARYYFYKQLEKLDRTFEKDISQRVAKLQKIAFQGNYVEKIKSSHVNTAIEQTRTLLTALSEANTQSIQKLEAIATYEKNTQLSKKKAKIAAAVTGVIVGAVGLVLGAAIGAGVGFGIGLGLGLWSGPGAMITAIGGAFAGATSTATAIITLLVPTVPTILLGLLGTGVGVGSGLFIRYHQSPVEKAIHKTAKLGKELVDIVEKTANPTAEEIADAEKTSCGTRLWRGLKRTFTTDPGFETI